MASLRCTLLLAAALLAAVVCPQQALAAYCTPEKSCWPTHAQLTKLKNAMSSPDTVVMWRTSSPHFLFSRSLAPTFDDNLLKMSFPGAGIVVQPANEWDLRRAVQFGGKHRIRVVARTSGHHQNSRANGDGILQIQTFMLKNLTYNAADQTVAFQAGCNHGDVYGFLVQYGRIYIGGKYKTVCPAGCLTGGCHGPLTRAYGLGIDNVRGLRIVLYNGSIAYASATSNPDLFHAMLGAGQSSYGVILTIIAQTHPAPPVVSRVVAKFMRPQSAEETPNVLTRFFFNASYMETLFPIKAGAYLESLGSALGMDYFNLDLIYIGTNQSEVQDFLTPLTESEWYIDGSLSVGTYATLYDFAVAAFGSGATAYQRSFGINILVPPEQDQLDVAATAVATGSMVGAYIWYTFGGNIRNGTAGSVSPGLRSAMIQINLGAIWSQADQDDSYLPLIAQVVQQAYQISPYSYINEYNSMSEYPGLGVPDFKTRFYSNYDRLVQVKKKYDPCNLFTVPEGVGSDMPAATCRA